MKKLSKPKICVLSIIIIIFLYIIINIFSIYNFSKVDETKKCDVAIVLGAAAYNTEVSEVYKQRLNHAILLYENGYCSKIIVTGGIAEDNTFSDAYAAKEYLLSQNIPENDILLEEKSKITDENLKYTKEIMDENGFKTALIVSDPLHMKRTMLLAKDNKITAYSSPTTTSAYKTNRTKIPFIIRETALFIGYKCYRIF